MATIHWTGNAHDVAQEVVIEVENPTEGDTFRIECNNKYVEVESTDGTVAEIINLFVALWADKASLPVELAELTAEAFTDNVDGLYKLRLTGTAGVPFTVSVSSASAAGFGATVSTIVQGSAATNEKQRIRFLTTPTGGTWDLDFDGQVATGIAYNASAATLTTALEGLSNIAPGDVVVVETGDGYEITFEGAYEGVNVPTLIPDGSNLTGGNIVDIETITDGSAVTNEVQEWTLEGDEAVFTISFNNPSSGTFVTAELGPTSADLSAAFLRSAIRDASNGVQTVSGLGGDVSVSRLEAGVFRITWQGTFGGEDIGEPSISVISGSMTLNTTTITNGSGSPTNEVQTVTLTTAPNGGTWDLDYDGQTASGLAYDISDTDLTTALEALSNIGASDVSVSRSGSGTFADPYVYTVTFQSALGGSDLQELTADPSSLTGGRMSVNVTQNATAGVNEVQRVTLQAGVTGGTFTLTFDGQTTGNIDWDATAAEVDAALEALSNIDASEVLTTGSLGGPWDITFQNDLGFTNQPQMTGDGTNLTGIADQSIAATTTVNATGKHFWSDADNWDTGAVPVNSDTVYIQHSSVSILYGLAQSAVTLAALYVDMSFEGTIGLPDYNELGYYEYRAKDLAIGATIQRFGDGDGPGWTLLRINNGSVNTTLTQVNSGTSDDDTLPATQWRGTGTNTVNVFGGQFGAAVYGGQTSTIGTINLGLANADEPEADIWVKLGRGVTLTTFNQYGGEAEVFCTIGGNLLNRAGVVTLIDAATVTGNVEIHGGRLNWYASGTIGGTVDVGVNGILDATKDPRTKTITGVCRLHPQATLIDRQRLITFTASIQIVNGGLQDVFLDLGRDIQLARTNI